jgi:hypothetical protein
VWLELYYSAASPLPPCPHAQLSFSDTPIDALFLDTGYWVPGTHVFLFLVFPHYREQENQIIIVGRIVDIIGKVHTEGMTEMISILGIVAIGKIVDLPKVGNVGRAAIFAVEFCEFVL